MERLKCSECLQRLSASIEFDSEEDLASHVREAHMMWTPFQCHSCPRRMGNLETLRKHQKSHGDGSDLMFIFFPDLEMQKHLNTSIDSSRPSSQQNLDCHLCNDWDSSPGLLSRIESIKSHLREHSGSHPFSCSYCKEPPSSSWLGVWVHQRKAHADLQKKILVSLNEVVEIEISSRVTKATQRSQDDGEENQRDSKGTIGSATSDSSTQDLQDRPKGGPRGGKREFGMIVCKMCDATVRDTKRWDDYKRHVWIYHMGNPNAIACSQCSYQTKRCIFKFRGHSQRVHGKVVDFIDSRPKFEEELVKLIRKCFPERDLSTFQHDQFVATGLKAPKNVSLNSESQEETEAEQKNSEKHRTEISTDSENGSESDEKCSNVPDFQETQGRTEKSNVRPVQTTEVPEIVEADSTNSEEDSSDPETLKAKSPRQAKSVTVISTEAVTSSSRNPKRKIQTDSSQKGTKSVAHSPKNISGVTEKIESQAHQFSSEDIFVPKVVPNKVSRNSETPNFPSQTSQLSDQSMAPVDFDNSASKLVIDENNLSILDEVERPENAENLEIKFHRSLEKALDSKSPKNRGQNTSLGIPETKASTSTPMSTNQREVPLERLSFKVEAIAVASFFDDSSPSDSVSLEETSKSLDLSEEINSRMKSSIDSKTSQVAEIECRKCHEIVQDKHSTSLRHHVWREHMGNPKAVFCPDCSYATGYALNSMKRHIKDIHHHNNYEKIVDDREKYWDEMKNSLLRCFDRKPFDRLNSEERSMDSRKRRRAQESTLLSNSYSVEDGIKKKKI